MGRPPPGSNAPFGLRNTRAAKLSPTQVQEIREFYARGAVSQGQLARDYGVSVVQIGRIVRGEVWQNLRAREPTRGELDQSAARLLEMQQKLEAEGLPAGLAKLNAIKQEGNEKVNTLLDEMRSPLDE